MCPICRQKLVQNLSFLVVKRLMKMDDRYTVWSAVYYPIADTLVIFRYNHRQLRRHADYHLISCSAAFSAMERKIPDDPVKALLPENIIDPAHMLHEWMWARTARSNRSIVCVCSMPGCLFNHFASIAWPTGCPEISGPMDIHT
jgi:hypothetical protein